eukprot:4178822-Amphidinium_carterae.1
MVGVSYDIHTAEQTYTRYMSYKCSLHPKLLQGVAVHNDLHDSKSPHTLIGVSLIGHSWFYRGLG